MGQGGTFSGCTGRVTLCRGQGANLGAGGQGGGGRPGVVKHWAEENMCISGMRGGNLRDLAEGLRGSKGLKGEGKEHIYARFSNSKGTDVTGKSRFMK